MECGLQGLRCGVNFRFHSLSQVEKNLLEALLALCQNIIADSSYQDRKSTPPQNLQVNI